MRVRAPFPFTSARLVLALVLTLASTWPVNGQGRIPVPAADHVTLVNAVVDTGPCFSGRTTVRVLPDGTKVPFVVPPGRVLLLTDMQGIVSQLYPALWNANHVGRVVTLRARGANQNNYQILEATAPLTSGAIAAGIAPVEIHLTSGVVMGPGSTVCVNASIMQSNGGFAAVGEARLQGILLDE